MEIIDCDQGSAEWYEARLGVITASCFQEVLPKSRGSNKGRLTYMYKLAAERIRNEVNDIFSSPVIERGHEFEELARNLYIQQTGNKVKPCGFIKNNYGYSPDGLVDDDGLIEIKTKSGHLQIDLLLNDAVPDEHIAQIQGGLMVSGRKWLDFISYCPGLPIYIKRVERDEQYIKNLRAELALFEKELEEVINAILTKF